MRVLGVLGSFGWSRVSRVVFGFVVFEGVGSLFVGLGAIPVEVYCGFRVEIFLGRCRFRSSGSRGWGLIRGYIYIYRA